MLTVYAKIFGRMEVTIEADVLGADFEVGYMRPFCESFDIVEVNGRKLRRHPKRLVDLIERNPDELDSLNAQIMSAYEKDDYYDDYDA